MRSQLTDAEAELARWARVARFASVAPDGVPHVVPISPVLDGDVLVFASEPTAAKLGFLRSNPRCALVFDEYSEDWSALRQVQVRGTATILSSGPEWDRGKALLDAKYPQYEPTFPIRPGETLIVRVRVERVTSDGF